MWNSDPKNAGMRRLNEVRELAKRLTEFDYDTQGFNEADERYGFVHWFTPAAGGTYEWKSTYKRNPDKARKFNNMRRKHYENLKRQHKDRLYYLLNKYLEHWWD